MHAVLFPLIGENCLTELQIVAHSSEGHVLRMGAKPVGGFFLFQMLRRLGGIHAPTVLTVFTMTCAGLLKMFPSMYVTISSPLLMKVSTALRAAVLMIPYAAGNRKHLWKFR